MTRLLCFTTVCALAVSPASADEYWVAYEGNDFPENVGWERTISDGGAQRSLNAGTLVLDSLHSVAIVDFYTMERTINPDPGELFLMQWSLRVDEISAREDPTVVVFSDDDRAAGFEFGDGYLIDTFNPTTRVTFEPYTFHEFEFRSRDMLTYELRIDDVAALSGAFFSVFESSRVSWGDGVQGSASLSRWDYFRFGVVPEPGTCMVLAAGFVMLVGSSRKRTKS